MSTPTSLLNLDQYKTISEKSLLTSFNNTLEAINTNFAYTLTQVTNSVPSPYSGYTGSLLTVGEDYATGGKSLIYKNPEDIFTFTGILAGLFYPVKGSNTPAAISYLEFPTKLNVALKGRSAVAGLRIEGRQGYGLGPVADYLDVNQLSLETGTIDERHQVSRFVVSCPDIRLNTTGFVQVDGLKINGSNYPKTVGTVGQVLKVGPDKHLEFGDSSQPYVLDQTTYFSLQDNKPLVLERYGYTSSNLQLGFGGITEGIGATQTYDRTDLYFAVQGEKAFEIVKPTNGEAYLKSLKAFVLPPASQLNSFSSQVGSLWFDSNSDSLVLVGSLATSYIKGSALASAITTSENKDFSLQPTATLTLGAGSRSTPAFNVGALGLSGENSEVVISVESVAAVKVSKDYLESATNLDATAKILLSGDVGINAPGTPAYSFSGSDRLGLYRSNINAMGVAVKGVATVEFKEGVIDAKGSKLTNLSNPINPLDGVNKAYVDNLVPSGTLTGHVSTVGNSGKLNQSNLKYLNGTLEVGETEIPAAVKLKNTYGGSTTLRVAGDATSRSFWLPSNSLVNGVLQLDSLGRTSWVAPSQITAGYFKANGSSFISGTIKSNFNSNPNNLAFAVGSVGLYFSGSESANDRSCKIGFGFATNTLMEIDGVASTLKGSTSTVNSPLIKLSGITTVDATCVPIYSFAADPQTGIGQKTIGSFSLSVLNQAKLTVDTQGVSACSNRIRNVATPTSGEDAANRAYVLAAIAAAVPVAVPDPVELYIRINALPAGYTEGQTITLSLLNNSLIYENSSASFTYNTAAVSTTLLTVPADFNTNAKCQVFAGGIKLLKWNGTNPVQAFYITSKSIGIRTSSSPTLAVGMILAIQLPGY